MGPWKGQGENVKEGYETTLIPAYGRRRMLGLAEAYRELARSYEKNCTGLPVAGTNRRDELYWKRIMGQRQFVAENLLHMADAVRVLAEENVTYHAPSRKKTHMISNGLKKHGIYLHDIYLLEKKETVQLVLTMHAERTADFTTDDIAEVLSSFFHRTFVSAKENMFFITYEPEVYIFELKPPFRLSTGVASAIKEGEHCSGDNYLLYSPSASEEILAISDGAGSGEEAAADSEHVLELLEKYVDSGFSIAQAGALINGQFLMLCREQNMPTLDACHVDLENGVLRFVKYGAVAGYILRGKSATRIRGGGFPLGFVGKEESGEEEETYDLYEWDSIVMISDGVLECFGGEESFVESLRHTYREDSTEAANYLMRCALQKGRGRVRDDMTILYSTLLY